MNEKRVPSLLRDPVPGRRVDELRGGQLLELPPSEPLRRSRAALLLLPLAAVVAVEKGIDQEPAGLPVEALLQPQLEQPPPEHERDSRGLEHRLHEV